MPGRAPIPEQVLLDAGYRRPEQVRRRVVLRETLAAFATAEDVAGYHAAAARNLARWHEARQQPEPRGELRVVRGDWGIVTAALTRDYGTCFAVLNMANAFKPGHDEAIFGEDASEFDITRPERMPDLYNQHRSFGIGQHFCIGSHLARLELKVMFEEVIPRLRNPQFKDKPLYVRSYFVNAMKQMNITFDAA